MINELIYVSAFTSFAAFISFIVFLLYVKIYSEKIFIIVYTNRIRSVIKILALPKLKLKKYNYDIAYQKEFNSYEEAKDVAMKLQNIYPGISFVPKNDEPKHLTLD